MATAEQMQSSITPGSLPYGERQSFEAALGQIPPNPVPATMSGGGAIPGMPTNPLDPLASGELRVNSDPITAGLSVGPGVGPEAAAVPDSMIERYRIISTQAKSPVLRHLARRALRGAVREQDHGF